MIKCVNFCPSSYHVSNHLNRNKQARTANKFDAVDKFGLRAATDSYEKYFIGEPWDEDEIGYLTHSPD